MDNLTNRPSGVDPIFSGDRIKSLIGQKEVTITLSDDLNVDGTSIQELEDLAKQGKLGDRKIERLKESLLPKADSFMDRVINFFNVPKRRTTDEIKTDLHELEGELEKASEKLRELTASSGNDPTKIQENGKAFGKAMRDWRVLNRHIDQLKGELKGTSLENSKVVKTLTAMQSQISAEIKPFTYAFFEKDKLVSMVKSKFENPKVKAEQIVNLFGEGVTNTSTFVDGLKAAFNSHPSRLDRMLLLNKALEVHEKMGNKGNQELLNRELRDLVPDMKTFLKEAGGEVVRGNEAQIKAYIKLSGTDFAPATMSLAKAIRDDGLTNPEMTGKAFGKMEVLKEQGEKLNPTDRATLEGWLEDLKRSRSGNEYLITHFENPTARPRDILTSYTMKDILAGLRGAFNRAPTLMQKVGILTKGSAVLYELESPDYPLKSAFKSGDTEALQKTLEVLTQVVTEGQVTLGKEPHPMKRIAEGVHQEALKNPDRLDLSLKVLSGIMQQPADERVQKEIGEMYMNLSVVQMLARGYSRKKDFDSYFVDYGKAGAPESDRYSALAKAMETEVLQNDKISEREKWVILQDCVESMKENISDKQIGEAFGTNVLNQLTARMKADLEKTDPLEAKDVLKHASIIFNGGLLREEMDPSPAVEKYGKQAVLDALNFIMGFQDEATRKIIRQRITQIEV